MKIFKYFSIALFSLVVVGGSKASFPAGGSSTIQFTWDIPTEREDGSSLLPVEIGGYHLYEEGLLVLEIEGGETTSAFYDYGTYGNACFTISTVDSWGQEGAQSAPVCLQILPAPPSAPPLQANFNR